LLIGKKLTPELAQEAASIASQECSPTSDLRGSEQYKRAIVKTLVKRATGKAYEKALTLPSGRGLGIGEEKTR
jgi:carbon-monoxide dehydrogenase medium subunit